MRKRIAVVIGMLAATHHAQAQADSIHVWNKWCAKSDTVLLFNQGYNQLQIYSSSIKPGNITLKSLDNSLRIGSPEVKGDTLTVLAMPYAHSGKPMRLAIIDSKTRKTLRTINCYSEDIPKLEARIGNLNMTDVPKATLLTQNVLRPSFPKSLYSYPYRIKEYTFKITSAKGSATINVKGFFLTKEVLTQINDAPVGTEVLFTNIKATCPECETRPVEDIKMKIK
jgi:hypothetical protein